MDAEKQLKALENDIKALKAGYPVAASKLKFVTTVSQEFSVTGSQTKTFRFTPRTGAGKVQFVSLRATITIDGAVAGYMPFVNLPQDGSGNVDIKVQFDPYSASTTYKVKIVASGTATGSFSMI